MKVEIVNGRLVITIDAHTSNPPASNSGKTLLVASTHGNKATTAMVDGKPLVVSVNAYIPR